MMARLLEALHPDARLILVGDHEQLASVEAGAVLGDIVGPAARGLCMDQAVRARLEEVTGHPVPDTTMTARSPIGDGVVVLRHVRRHGGAIAGFARAVQAGDADAALAELAAEDSNVDWLALDPSDPATAERLDPIHDRAVESGRVVIEAAREGDAETRSTPSRDSASSVPTGGDRRACGPGRRTSSAGWRSRSTGSKDGRAGTSAVH